MDASATRPPCSDEVAPRLGITPTVTEAAVSEANVELVSENRCISVGHKTQLSRVTLVSLRHAGVRYISTRSVGYNHIDMAIAKNLGISVENVMYSPDSVADYTLMLMLMVVRHAKSTISRAQSHDYRLNDVRGRELRDMTIGVVGTGRIGAAVIDRLRGFGCRVLAYDRCPKASNRVGASRRVVAAERCRHAPCAAQHGYAPSLESSTHRADAAWRLHHQHGTRVASRYRGASLSVGRVAGSAARHWMSSKERKVSSTPTTVRGPLRTDCCCGCNSFRMW